MRIERNSSVSSHTPAVALHGFYSAGFGEVPFASRTYVRSAGIDCATGLGGFLRAGVGPIRSSFRNEASIGRFLEATASAIPPQAEPVRRREISGTGL